MLLKLALPIFVGVVGFAATSAMAQSTGSVDKAVGGYNFDEAAKENAATKKFNSDDGKLTFAIITHTAGNGFFDPTYVGAKVAADLFGVNLIMLGSEAPVDDIPRELEILNQIIQDPTIDGIILTTPQSGAYDDIVAKASERGIPVATTNSFDPIIKNRNQISHTGQDASAAAIGGEAMADCVLAAGKGGSIIFPNTTTLGNVEVNNRITAAFQATVKKLEAAGAMIAQSAAALRTATVVRDYVTIEAPSQGYVVKRLVAPGVLVQPGMAILKIARIDRVRLQANVGERDLAGIRVGAPVVVRSLAADQAALPARVTSVFPFVDQGSRTAVVEALVENPTRRLLPGQYVAMTIVIGERPGALTVPRAAVGRLGRASIVWVARDGLAERREVVTGLENADRLEIKSGLAEGERVVVRGREGLYVGARVVEARRATPPGQSGARDGLPGTAPPAPAERAPAKETTHGGH